MKNNKTAVFLGDDLQNPMSMLLNDYDQQVEFFQTLFGKNLINTYTQHDLKDFIEDIRTKRPDYAFLDYGGLSGHRNEFIERIQSYIVTLAEETTTRFVILCTFSPDWYDLPSHLFTFVGKDSALLVFFEKEFGFTNKEISDAYKAFDKTLTKDLNSILEERIAKLLC